MRPLTAEWLARAHVLWRLRSARPERRAQGRMHWERGLWYVCVLTFASVVPALRAFADDGKDPKQLAERFAECIRQAEGLSFEAIVSHQREQDDGRLVPMSARARAVVSMAKGALHCRVFDGDRLLAVINCDSRNVTEWNCVVNQWTRYPQPAPSEGADLILDEGVDGCLIGSYLRPWLPDPGESELLRTALNVFESFRDGRYVGTERVEDRICDVVSYPPDEEALPRHTFWLDADGLLVKWITRAEAPVDGVEAVVVRTRLYRNLSTEPVDRSTFEFTPPEGATHVEP
jgi:hypothetical protein